MLVQYRLLRADDDRRRNRSCGNHAKYKARLHGSCENKSRPEASRWERSPRARITSHDESTHKIGKSTKGYEVLQPFLERVVLWLIENYDPPAVALDPQ
jgi:hypothetical protein